MEGLWKKRSLTALAFLTLAAGLGSWYLFIYLRPASFRRLHRVLDSRRVTVLDHEFSADFKAEAHERIEFRGLLNLLAEMEAPGTGHSGQEAPPSVVEPAGTEMTGSQGREPDAGSQ